MANGQEVMIDAPIPGQSLTAPVGGRPWQQPPQYATVEDALDLLYFPKFQDLDFSNQILEVIDLGVPLTTIANSFQMASVMDGKHTIDVGILIIPVLVELMINMAEANDVEYNSGMEKDKEDGFSHAQIALAKKKGLLDAKPVEKPEMPMPEEQAEPSPMGLMSRREV